MDICEIKNPEELLDYMSKNITYGFVGKNGKKYTNMFSDEWNDWYEQCMIQSGEEVFSSKVGTCWDQVELERLWFDKNKYNYYTFFMWFEVGRECDYPTHTFLVYEYKNKFYWFENAFEAQRGIHEFNTLDETIEYVKLKQIEYTKMNFKDASDKDMSCLTVYEYSKPIDHLNVNEYLNHVIKNPYNKDLNNKF